MIRTIRAFSLVELLICVAIISILATVSFVYYQGSLDHTELKGVLPKIVAMMDGYRKRANERNAIVVAEFIESKNEINVTWKFSAGGNSGARVDRVPLGLLKRRLVFRSYAWPDGSKTPRSFTFIPRGKPQGGTIVFGSSYAEGKIFVSGDSIDSSLP